MWRFIILEFWEYRCIAKQHVSKTEHVSKMLCGAPVPVMIGNIQMIADLQVLPPIILKIEPRKTAKVLAMDAIIFALTPNPKAALVTIMIKGIAIANQLIVTVKPKTTMPNITTNPGPILVVLKGSGLYINHHDSWGWKRECLPVTVSCPSTEHTMPHPCMRQVSIGTRSSTIHRIKDHGFGSSRWFACFWDCCP